MLPTARLHLVPFHPEHLLTLVDEPASFEAAFGAPAADGLRSFFVSGDVSAAWLGQLRSASEPDPWRFGFAVVHRETRQVIGSGSFKGPPDAEGVVEIAYAIVPAFEGQGYATEVAGALVAFALAHPVSVVRAHTLPERNASTRVLSKCGFAFVGEVEDPDDGPVWRWEHTGGAA
jgi:[ribosomal protein S5]-alanine N-acetyltransferase